MKLFQLVRDTDVSKVSGTGVVAEGVVFTDGTVALRWTVEGLPQSTVMWDCVEHAEQIHGHDGATRLVYL